MRARISTHLRQSQDTAKASKTISLCHSGMLCREGVPQLAVVPRSRLDFYTFSKLKPMTMQVIPCNLTLLKHPVRLFVD